jgi:hypothetical protein
MKKYIFTENQMKKILDNVVEDHIITEQTFELNAKKAIQCFLNKVVDAKLEVDGLHGDATQEAIAKFQRTKKYIDIDGVWGYSTSNAMTDEEKKIMKSCKSEHGDLIDKFLIWLGIG